MATAKGKAAAEVDALARALDMRGRELAKLKQLSAAVLQQRGDLETFLLSSIDMVHALALPSTRPHSAYIASLRPSTSCSDSI